MWPVGGPLRGGLVVALGVWTWSLLPGATLPAAAQGVPVGTAQNAVGTLVVVRTDGIEHRLQGRGSLPLFEGDVLRTEAGGQALIQLRPGMRYAKAMPRTIPAVRVLPL